MILHSTLSKLHGSIRRRFKVVLEVLEPGNAESSDVGHEWDQQFLKRRKIPSLNKTLLSLSSVSVQETTSHHQHVLACSFDRVSSSPRTTTVSSTAASVTGPIAFGTKTSPKPSRQPESKSMSAPLLNPLTQQATSYNAPLKSCAVWPRP